MLVTALGKLRHQPPGAWAVHVGRRALALRQLGALSEAQARALVGYARLARSVQ